MIESYEYDDSDSVCTYYSIQNFDQMLCQYVLDSVLRDHLSFQKLLLKKTL